jgi:hypothetical protein
MAAQPWVDMSVIMIGPTITDETRASRIYSARTTAKRLGVAIGDLPGSQPATPDTRASRMPLPNKWDRRC